LAAPNCRIPIHGDTGARDRAKIDALYAQAPRLPADFETDRMAKLRREAHARMLGDGLCTLPAELDCRMESACETCGYSRTSVEFKPTRERQQDHARERGQHDREALFTRLLASIEPRT
jgi:hypothetical protein